MTETLKPQVLSAVSEVEMIPLYFTLPRNLWRLIPEWVKLPSFENTPTKNRVFSNRSEELFRGEMFSMAYILQDLAKAGIRPVEAFYLDRETNTRRVRITCQSHGEPLTDEQIASFSPLFEEYLYDTMVHRSGPTKFLPEHMPVNNGNPFHSPGGGMEAVRVIDGKICRQAIYSAEEREESKRSVISNASRL